MCKETQVVRKAIGRVSDCLGVVGCVVEPHMNMRSACWRCFERVELFEVIGPCINPSGQCQDVVLQHGNISDIYNMLMRFVATSDW